MKGKCIITAMIAVIATVAAVTPAAQAGPLLSGYGGPGTGSQAILGSTLLNGPRGGGGASSGGGSGASAGGVSGFGSPGAQATGAAGRSHRAAGAGGAGGPSPAGQGGTSRAGEGNGGGPSAGRPAALYPSAQGEAQQSSPMLGLSAADLLYLLLALAALALTGLLSARLARGAQDGGSGQQPGMGG
jgi:hypothetical protein